MYRYIVDFFPAGTGHRNDVALTLMRRKDVASTSVWPSFRRHVPAWFHAIFITSTTLGVHDRHKLVPNVFVSEMQWSFLSNGSPRCFADVHSNIYSNFGEFYVDWILIKCANKPVGKYITLLWTRLNHSVNTEPIYMYFFQSTRLFQIITTEGMFLCAIYIAGKQK